MKTKLLKEVRKRFSVHYHPNIESDFKYIITDNFYGDTLNDPFNRHRLNRSHNNKESALNTIIDIMRSQYRKYSRKYKMSKVKTKVWHNNPK